VQCQKLCYGFNQEKMKVFKYQLWHFLMLSILLAGVYFFISKNGTLLNGELWGITTSKWLWFAILTPILHQTYVLIFWRLELFYGSISKIFGDNGFKIYKIGFAILFVSRLITIILLAISSAKTLAFDPVFANILAGLLFLPAVYLFYSVRKYFGIDRAFGIDHFHPEELKKVPFVNGGIFKYFSNAMYIFGFFILWVPGLLWLSQLALLVALFNHLYIWVHYYFTELPDIKVIYGE